VGDRRFYEALEGGQSRRSAPAALRNREPIAEVLRDWLPQSGLVLEVASGTGEHVVYFADAFPHLDWQPSDTHPDALASIAAWREESGLPNVRAPIRIDAGSTDWPIDQADAALNINMAHISPWSASLGLISGAARVLPPGGSLILYGPWLKNDVETVPSNLAFDADLKRRDPDWGLRKVEDFAAAAANQGFDLSDTRGMPANNLMLLFRLGEPRT
jgi:SAM-dependent methyltransferase